jgi:hypothetical protein
MTASVFPRTNPRSKTDPRLRAALAMGCVGLWMGVSRAQVTLTTFPVRGTVVNSVTGQPIARALVDANEDATLTDGEGRFELRLSYPEAQITVRRPGYSDKQEDTTHRVRLAAEMPELQFSLPPAASLTGRVTLSSGDEAAGIQFVSYRRQLVDGRSRWMPGGMTETNSEGVFQFSGIEAPGSYVMCSVEVRDHFVFHVPSAALWGYPATCFPGGSDFLSAEPVNVMPGQQKDMEIVLTRQRLYLVTISMLNPQFATGTRTHVYDRAGRPTSTQAHWVSKNGALRAEMELPNGSYSLEMQSGGKQQEFGRIDFRVANGPVTGLSLNLVPMHPVVVEIRKDYTAVAQQNGFRFLENGNGQAPSVNLSLLPRDDLIDGPMGTGLSHPEGAAAGVFQMEGIRPGRYLVRADAYDGYVSSITSGGSDLARDPLILGAGGTAAPIEVTLRNDWGEIECDVKAANGELAAGVAAGAEIGSIHLVAIPQFATASRIPQMTLGNPGQFTWNQIPPGTYRVLAFDKEPEINLDDAKEVARWSGLGQVVKVNPGATATVQLQVIHLGDVRANP